MSEILGEKKEELFLKMLLIEDRIFKLALGSQWSIYLVLMRGPFQGFIGLASGPAGANRDDPCNGNSCFLH